MNAVTNLPAIEAVKKHIPSQYQQAVYDFMEYGSGNAVVSAVAGSGKTSTILGAVRLIPETKKALYLAFNRDIVKELEEKAGDVKNLLICTLHKYGKSCIRKHLKRSKLDENKYRNLLKNIYRYLDGVNEALDEYGFDSDQMDLIRQFEVEQPQDGQKIDMKAFAGRILKLADLGRLNLTTSVGLLEQVAEKHDIALINGEAQKALYLIQLGTAYTKTYDFCDMIYLPVRLKLKGKQFDWVFVDECQDLNTAQRYLMMMAIKPKTGRFIAVGDERQAIYGFAGADVVSYQKLKTLPNTIELPLSVCYRCGSNIINLAKNIVPQIEAAPNAKEGEVNEEALVEHIVDGDMVLCRNTYPLVRLCFDLLKKGIKANIKGRDIGSNLINMIEGTECNKMEDVVTSLERELMKIRNKIMRKEGVSEREAEESQTFASYKEKIDIIVLFSDGTQNVQEVISKIEGVFSDTSKSGVQLSTIHKSKGLEADRVFILMRELMPSKWAKTEWEQVQEKNLEYVAYTRAKSFLGFVTDFAVYPPKKNFGKDEVNVEGGAAAANSTSEWVGTVGGKLQMELTITDVLRGFSKQTQKPWTLYTMSDSKGNILKSFGWVKPEYITSDHEEPVVGATIKVTCFIGKHEEFRGKKSTFVKGFAAY